MIRIWGDLNVRDSEGRVLLSRAEDMKAMDAELQVGLRVVIWMEDVEAEGTLEYEDGAWRARIAWDTLKDRETGRRLDVRRSP